MLTASDLYKAIGTEGIRRALIIKKCKNNTGNSSGLGSACKHGIKYEDIAILIYEKTHFVINKLKSNKIGI